MKQLFMMLVLVGMTHMNTTAKTPSKKHTVTDKNQNYPVCKTRSGTYQICGRSDDRVMYLPARSPQRSVGSLSSYATPHRKHTVVIVDDDMHNPYEGKPSQQNDGPEKNEERNKNIYQTSTYLAPSSGNNSH